MALLPTALFSLAGVSLWTAASLLTGAAGLGRPPGAAPPPSL